MAVDGPVYGVPTDIIDDVLPQKEEGSDFTKIVQLQDPIITHHY